MPGATTPAPAKVRHRGQLRPRRQRSFCTGMRGKMQGQCPKKCGLRQHSRPCAGAPSSVPRPVRGMPHRGSHPVSDHPANISPSQKPLGHPARNLVDDSGIRVDVGLERPCSPPKPPPRPRAACRALPPTPAALLRPQPTWGGCILGWSGHPRRPMPSPRPCMPRHALPRVLPACLSASRVPPARSGRGWPLPPRAASP